MKEIKFIKLGTCCLDKATKLNGTLTHWLYNLGGNVEYFFQPRGLDKEGQPVDHLGVVQERLENVTPDDYEKVKVPIEILGTRVRDKASGFEGMAISFLRHINGCFHVLIQPEGLNPQNNGPVRRTDFDLRGCEGEMIKPLGVTELKKSKEKTPSPLKINLGGHGKGSF